MDSSTEISKQPPPQQRRLPVLPWKTRITLFFLNAVTDASRRSDGTVNRRLFRFLDSLSLKTPPNSNPRNGGVKTSDITVDTSRNLWFRLYVPPASSATTTSDSDQPLLPLVVFFHGGGFVYLAPDFKAYDDVCRRFCSQVPAVIVSVNYRLAPEHSYPAQYDDGFDVLKFLDDQTHLLPENADLSRCFLAGDSAGANLAHHVAVRASQSKFTHLKARSPAHLYILQTHTHTHMYIYYINLRGVRGLVAIQPFFGGEERTKSEMELAEVDAIVTTKRTDWMWKSFMPGGDRDHQVINVSGPRAFDISKLDCFPPTMVVVAAFDSLKDWQLRYYEWLKNSGKQAYLVHYPTMFHAFYVFPELPESAHLVSQVKHFIHNHYCMSQH
ncbi:hypothetical protein BUALT_Bualt04G0000700 [Buddleja alternifolia]|uniref:Alpha/beta hydrolase fold-3 domain-containing protein n=1 Tax=Buddleja alternifolia TaxID=168488 RepID=A0AAV6XK51_9LAMI|nr:hypothetical protein BUALT_Bualt04G0000700 [Buddleja alternifolia]